VAFGVSAPVELWFGIAATSAGVFGVPLGFAACVIVSLLTPAPSAEQRRFIRELRHPPRPGQLEL
jgi:cation/acetate symporter